MDYAGVVEVCRQRERVPGGTASVRNSTRCINVETDRVYCKQRLVTMKGEKRRASAAGEVCGGGSERKTIISAMHAAGIFKIWRGIQQKDHLSQEQMPAEACAKLQANPSNINSAGRCWTEMKKGKRQGRG